MAVYFGSTGLVELKRDSFEGALRTTLKPDDVTTSRKRFSVENALDSIITGDQIEISSVDKSSFELVSGHNYPDLVRYVYVDEVGGIKLYDEFNDALSGDLGTALTLVDTFTALNVEIRTRNVAYRSLAKIKDYNITTTRENIDLSILGEQYRKQFEQGRISGQGDLNCLWDYKSVNCEFSDIPEFPQYLARLLLRVNQGSSFDGRFFIYFESVDSSNNVWYESSCVITNVAITAPADGLITSRIEFVTNGPVVLRSGTLPSYLLQEDSDYILQEDGNKITLED